MGWLTGCHGFTNEYEYEIEIEIEIEVEVEIEYETTLCRTHSFKAKATIDDIGANPL